MTRAAAAVAAPARIAPYLELAKPRIVAMVAATAAAGYYMSAPPAAWWPGLVHAMIGTALVAGGASALNQVAERDVDALMLRTARRPLPSGRVSAAAAAVLAWACAAAGIAYLTLFTNVLTAALAAGTLAAYVGLYTPLKRLSPFALLVGAVPGALPIVGGWTASGAAIDARALGLFAILFLWQVPHFLALAWIYREDYARAGLRVAGVGDADGVRTFQRAAVGAAALIPVSLAPTVLGLAGPVYFFGAAVLSGWLAWAAAKSVRERSNGAARRLFAASLVYLPALLALMTADRAR
ncbi:MAG: heme o synthase [Gemmatimonadota bacterium]|nr:heme o synthase [Gemmatimonadota bacterium]